MSSLEGATHPGSPKVYVYRFTDKGLETHYVWVESDVPLEEDYDTCHNWAEESFMDNYGYIPDEFVIEEV